MEYQISYAVSPTKATRAYNRSLALLNPVIFLNFSLAALAAGLLLYYVLTANAISSDKYLLRTLDNRVISLSETHTSLTQQQADLASLTLLESFAKAHGMVEAQEVSYLFEGNNVAYRR